MWQTVKNWIINFLGGSASSLTAADIAQPTIVGQTADTSQTANTSQTADTSQTQAAQSPGGTAADIQSAVSSAINQISQGVTSVTAAAAAASSTPATSPIGAAPVVNVTAKKKSVTTSGVAQLATAKIKNK